MKNKGLLFLLLFQWSISAWSQQYANEWIDPNQRYFRIPIIEEGLYNISQTQLVSAGISLSTPPNRFQVFRKGEELAINVNSENNVVSSIEFYARPNDGVNDSGLYRTPEAQPHQYYSLFADTAAYFLTWKIINEDGKRMSTDATLTTATVEPFHLEEILIIETERYSLGDKYRDENDLASAYFDLGEGYTGVSRGKTGVFTYTINIENQNETSGKLPSLELLVQGRNNLSHRSELLIGPSGTQLRVLDTLEGFTGFESYLFSGDLLWSDFTNGQCVVQLKVLGYDGASDNQSISYFRLIYPQNLDILSTENKVFNLNPSSDDLLYVRVPTTNSATRIFDITDEFEPIIRLTETGIESGAIFFAVNEDPFISRKILAVTNPLEVENLKEAIFEPINPSGSDYLIISHSLLMMDASDGIDPVAAYAEYRETEFDVYLVEIGDIYDQFNYGDPSPIAIKNYLNYALSLSEVEYLFLIGKGMLLDYSIYREPNYASGTRKPHFIPTYGNPGSDALFSVGLTDNLIPAIPTGRLSAQTSEDVKNYLDKVKQMEALPYDALWRKNILQLSGGQTLPELNAFRLYIDGFKVTAESDYLGGQASNQGKSTVAATEDLSVGEQLEEGVSLVTFFGHSTSFTTDIDIGNVSEQTNSSKYPLLFVNGCNGGSIFGEFKSFGERWMIQENQKGAIGVVAHSDLALSSGLRRLSSLFYENQFGTEETFGLSIGEVLELVQRSYFNKYGVTDESISQVYGTVLQSDPAYKIFGTNSPDYATSDSEVWASAIGSDRIVSNSPLFALNIVVSNFGKTVKDSLSIKVDRTLSDGTPQSYIKKFLRPLYKDTILFTIENDLASRNDGQNIFSIVLDPSNQVDEINEANNFAVTELFIPKGNTINLYPIEYATVNSSDVSFIWQSADLLSESRSYSFELDTTKSFSSIFLKTSQITAELLITQEMDLSQLNDSTTVFWRTRFAEPLAEEDTSWVSSSFTIVETADNEGWGQFSDQQLLENEITGVSLSESTKEWEFLSSTFPVEIRNHGLLNANGYDKDDLAVIINDINLLQNNSSNDRFCILNTFNAMVFDRETAAPIRPFGYEGNDLLNPLVCGLTPQLIHNFTRDNILGGNRYIDSLISVMDVGASILLFSFDSVAYSEWDDQLKQSLAEVGIRISTIESLVDGQPSIFLGKKGIAEGEAVEIVNNGNGLPVEEQSLSLAQDIEGVFSSGVIKSGNIGPAQAWNNFTFGIENAGGDEIFIGVKGTTNNGIEDFLFYDEFSDLIDLTSVDANQYPYLSFDFEIYDQGDQMPCKLNNWSVGFVAPPEGILIADDKTSVEIEEGETFSRSFKFLNISKTDFSDSLDANFSFFNVAEGTELQEQKILGPKASDTVSFEVSFESLNRVGDNTLNISIEPNETELFAPNNALSLMNIVSVERDETNPVLDVTFDGIFILDGDIVSPTPRIVIKFHDDNQYLYKSDTTGIDIMIKSPCEGCDFERVNMTSPNVVYSIASEAEDFEIEYTPEALIDGIYQLMVQGEDQSGNVSGIEPYQISFEVINESSITHFYPYPNPFSTSTRFVFTLTGSEIPDQLKIQIMTISGRVVREILQDEIGPLRIGNNISEYAWDGKDEFGDQLANGVYLYKVFIRQAGDKIKHRTTTADRAFKNGFGKIYLLR